jgi:hypothetical protein
MAGDDDAVLHAAQRTRPDDAAVVSFILGGKVTRRWQLAGDALLAVSAGAEGRERAADVVVDALHQRGDRGDWFLAAHLVAAVGLPGPTILADHGDRLPELTPVAVDLDSVADVIDRRGAGGWIDVVSGFAVDQELVDPDDLEREEDESDEERPRWIQLDSLGSGDAYQDMADFVDSLPDSTPSESRLRARLTRALRGDRPFRRFADAMHEAGADELSRWYDVRDERRLGRARRHLVDCGYLPLPLSTRRSDDESR